MLACNYVPTLITTSLFVGSNNLVLYIKITDSNFDANVHCLFKENTEEIISTVITQKMCIRDSVQNH